MAMTYAERLARLLYTVFWIVITGTALWLAQDFAAGALPFQAKIDQQTGTSGLLVETDAGTGCQYVVTPWGGIVARTGLDGRQICGHARP